MDFPLFSFGKKEKEEQEAKKQVLQALKALRDGDQPGKVVCNLQGIDREIAEVVNEIVIKHQACASEIKRVASETKEGRDTRVKIDNARGTWLDIMGSTDKILNSHADQLRVFNTLMQAIAKGDFSKKIFLEMEGEANNLKNTINGLVDTLNCFTSEVCGVLSSIGSQGKFGRTVETPSRFFEGSWLDMAEQVSAMSTQMDEHLKEITTIISKRVDESCEVSSLAELSKSVNNLVQASDVSLRYCSSFSHELRTPLNGIVGCSELLLDSGSLSNEQREMVMCIKQSGLTLIDIWNDLISYERLRNERMNHEEVSFSLRQTCERALWDAKRLHKTVELNLDIDPQIPDTLIGSAFSVEKIIHYIAKFALSSSRETDVLVSVNQKSLDGENIVLSIDINSLEIRAELKELFSDKSEMYGLDFPIVLRLVKQLQGSILAERTKKPGEAIFTIDLPLKVAASQTTNIPARLAQRALLVVCPHEVTQRVLARAIEWLGMKPVVTENPDKAIEILQQPEKSDYAAVLVDGDAEENGKVIEFVRNRKDKPLLVMADKDLPRNLTRIAKPVGPISLLDALLNADALRSRATSQGTQVLSKHDERILFAEENPVNRKVFEKMLQKMGYDNATMVETGADALVELEKGNFDVIFLGNNHDMFETNQAIRSRDKTVPIIGVTSLAKTAETHEKFVNAGLEYITKPVNFKNLNSLLSTLFEAKEKAKEEKAEESGIEGEFVLVENK
eukprot:Phypoly_transcript_03314.p1 GENE.Phypoly_transcript_03314~~Phypoly_transcript_03314.p1  ORF type:complete len:758 (+),score=154.00 Phypoly_transcript_03314:74-2275(+)